MYSKFSSDIGRKFSFTAMHERSGKTLFPNVYPMIYLPNMVIPILMHFCSLISHWSILFILQDILSRILDVIKSDVALQQQVY